VPFSARAEVGMTAIDTSNQIHNEAPPTNPNRPLLKLQRHKPDRDLVAALLGERLHELPPDSIRRSAIIRLLGGGEAMTADT